MDEISKWEWDQDFEDLPKACILEQIESYDKDSANCWYRYTKKCDL